jgi:hypothetical protein
MSFTSLLAAEAANQKTQAALGKEVGATTEAHRALRSPLVQGLVVFAAKLTRRGLLLALSKVATTSSGFSLMVNWRRRRTAPMAASLKGGMAGAATLDGAGAGLAFASSVEPQVRSKPSQRSNSHWFARKVFADMQILDPYVLLVDYADNTKRSTRREEESF